MGICKFIQFRVFQDSIKNNLSKTSTKCYKDKIKDAFRNKEVNQAFPVW